MNAPSTSDHAPVRVVAVIARLNIGGAAIQVISLARLMCARGYATRLVRGVEGPDEGTMDDLADALGVHPTFVGALRRDPGPADLAALVSLVRILRRDRPRIVHTHAAKAGTLGRCAALIAFPRRRPILVHTYHGHSLSGYFSSRTTDAYRRIERWLARWTDTLVAVSPEVRDELVELGVAAAEKFAVLPLGLDLGCFLDDGERLERRASLRAEWGIDEDDELVTLVARLVPIKRVDRFLRVAEQLMDRPRARFVVVGDGELRDELRASDAARKLGDRLVWAGFRDDMAGVCFASDVVTLTSDNEGTPVSLIEAQAAATPVVSTAVGGVASAVLAGVSGLLVPAEDERALAEAVRVVLDDRQAAASMGRAGRDHVRTAFGVERLVDDLDALYGRLLAEAS